MFRFIFNVLIKYDHIHARPPEGRQMKIGRKSSILDKLNYIANIYDTRLCYVICLLIFGHFYSL